MDGSSARVCQWASWRCMCGHCSGFLNALCHHTHSLISPSQDGYVRPCPPHTHRHQTTQASGEPWEGHFMLPDGPVRPQWRPSNTRAVATTYRACVCTRSRIRLHWQVCGDEVVTYFYIVPTKGSRTFLTDLKRSSTTSDVSTQPSPTVCVSMEYSSYLTASSLLIFIVPVCVGGSERGGWIRSKCWHSPCVFVAVLVWSGLVMWQPQLCSISLGRPSPNHDGNYQGQISRTCWIMGYYNWLGTACLGWFICKYVFMCVIEPKHVLVRPTCVHTGPCAFQLADRYVQ